MHTPNPSTAVIQSFAAVWSTFAFLFLGLIVLQIVMNWQIAEKAGYDGALSLLMLIPLVNVAILLIFAFGDWPVQQELRALRAAASGTVPPAAPPGTTIMPT